MGVIGTSNPDGSMSFTSTINGNIIARLRELQGFDNGIASYVRFADDFFGDTLNTNWSGAKGSDGSAVVPAIVAGGLNGICRLTTGAAGTTMAADGSSLTSELNYKASSGGLYLRSRLKINTAVTNICLNIGFTDTIATGTLEMPFTISGTTITSNATDAACFVFDTAQTTDIFYCQGVKADTDTALLASTGSIVPVADTYATYEILVDSGGSATFYFNGALVGTVANALTASVALTPIIAATARTTTSKVVDIDYIEICSLRA